MVQLGTRKTALALYGVLLVLPTVVLGGLHWHQLSIDHRASLAAVPGDVADAGRRLEEALVRRVRELLEREDQRPFYHYRSTFFEPGTIGPSLSLVPSPLETGPVPPSIQTYFAYERHLRTPAPPKLFFGGRKFEPDNERRQDDLDRAVRSIQKDDFEEFALFALMRPRRFRNEQVDLTVAAINTSREEDYNCLQDELPALRELQSKTQELTLSEFRLRFYREEDGTPRCVATRGIHMPANKDLLQMPTCFEALGHGALLRQGFFLDPVWLFQDLPALLAKQVLDSSLQYLAPGATHTSFGRETEVVTIRPIRALAFETRRVEDAEFGRFQIVSNTAHLEARFRTQMARFFGVAAMLALSLATGMVLLLRSVNRDLEAARRTENFVAAVTHELRTPLAAIRLYGEMLEEGWVDDPAKKAEYYKRIVRETARLETLVERVLEKSQMTRTEAKPEPGDLNEVIEGLSGSLSSLGPEGMVDLAFDFAPDLPAVMLVPEGVRSIVTNLVENARKYAPVPRNVEGAEPIRVVTHILSDQVVLDVLDRGPGIPSVERSKIFQAFYRVGNEHTRTTRGTGLGLHLVMLQSQAMKARVQVLDRKGGGTVFRVTFTRAPVA